MNNEQYRALVNKLQQLDELKIGDINPATGQRITGGLTDSEGNLVGSGTPGVNWNQQEEPVAAPTPEPEVTLIPEPTIEPGPTPEPVSGGCDPETMEKIKYMPSFNQAFAAARAAGCETFQWCGVYKTKAPQAAKPTKDAWYGALGKGSENSANLNKPDPTAAAFGNPHITAQGRKAGATRLPGQGV